MTRPAASLFVRRVEDTACTIEIAHDEHDLFAHVLLDGDPELAPGDEVLVLGAPVHVSFGERRSLRRPARIVRASAVGRLWTKIAALFELTELYEVSFTPGPVPGEAALRAPTARPVPPASRAADFTPMPALARSPS